MKKEMNSSGAYLTFGVHKEEFASSIAFVKEIIEMPDVTKIPQSPAYMKGIINLRGNVLPVVDLSVRFGLPTSKDTYKTRVIVFELRNNENKILIGGVVDYTDDVVQIEEEALLPPPALEDEQKVTYIENIVSKDDKFIMIVDVEKVFDKEELKKLDAITLATATA
ncbi:MAG: chemotaxis protein CheW [Bacteroidota bacterium]